MIVCEICLAELPSAHFDVVDYGATDIHGRTRPPASLCSAACVALYAIDKAAKTGRSAGWSEAWKKAHAHYKRKHWWNR